MAHDHEIYMTLADIAAELQDLGALRKYAPALEKLAERDNHQLYLAIAHRAFGVAHRLDDERSAAETRLSKALELFTQLGALWQVGRTFFELGTLHQAHSPAKARDYYLQALNSFEGIRAAPYAHRSHVALGSLT